MSAAGLRVVVCGGRVNHDGWSALWAVLANFQRDEGPIAAVIQGGARGVDEDARTWAKHFGVQCETYAADWQTHGQAAGPIRNRKMLTESRPDWVLPFQGGRGTADCVRQAHELGIKVWSL